MEAKEAIKQAKALIGDLYSDDDITDVRLEELEFDEAQDSWLITLGMIWPFPAAAKDLPSILRGTSPTKRIYKIVTIPNLTLKKPSMKIRQFGLDE